MGRSWKQISRDRATNVARLGSNISSAAIFGAIFWRMARKQSSIQDRLGLLQVGGDSPVCWLERMLSSFDPGLGSLPDFAAVYLRWIGAAE